MAGPAFFMVEHLLSMFKKLTESLSHGWQYILKPKDLQSRNSDERRASFQTFSCSVIELGFLFVHILHNVEMSFPSYTGKSVYQLFSLWDWTCYFGSVYLFRKYVLTTYYGIAEISININASIF